MRNKSVFVLGAMLLNSASGRAAAGPIDPNCPEATTQAIFDNAVCVCETTPVVRR